ncbi:MAG: DegT/DnrJ/EryC1/StrS family aminotransferase [Stellaceae bacterium]
MRRARFTRRSRWRCGCPIRHPNGCRCWARSRAWVRRKIRRATAVRYDAGLPLGLPLGLPVWRAGASHVYHQYVVRLGERDRLRDHLRQAGIGSGIHYPVPVRLHPVYRGRLALDPAGLGESERAADEILSLPMYPQFAGGAADRVIAEIRRFFR